MASIGEDDYSDSDSSSDAPEPNWDLLKETLGPDALKALEEHMTKDDDCVDDALSNTASSPVTMPQQASNRSTIVLPEHNKDYGEKKYWDDRFAEEEEFNWLVGYDDVRDLMAPFMSKDSKVLLVGCGNSNFSAEIYDAGFLNLTNIDYSEVVIDVMREKHRETRPEMKWVVMDMTDMSAFEDASFDVVIDKAALDALMTHEGDVWNPNQKLVDQSRSMCQHISRILVPTTGTHLHISFAQPHFRNKYLLGWHPPSGEAEGVVITKDNEYSHEFGWTYRVETIAVNGNDGCFHPFLYIMTKEKR